MTLQEIKDQLNRGFKTEEMNLLNSLQSQYVDLVKIEITEKIIKSEECQKLINELSGLQSLLSRTKKYKEIKNLVSKKINEDDVYSLSNLDRFELASLTLRENGIVIHK